MRTVQLHTPASCPQWTVSGGASVLAQNITVLDTARALGAAVGVFSVSAIASGHFVEEAVPWTFQQILERGALGHLLVTHVDGRRLLPTQLFLVERGKFTPHLEIDDPFMERGIATGLRRVQRLRAGERRVSLVNGLEVRVVFQPCTCLVVLTAEFSMKRLAAFEEGLQIHADRRSLRYGTSLSSATRSCTSVSRSRTVTV